MDEVNAARGGLEGGEGRPEEGTSGIPLGPCDPRSAVVEALEVRGRVNDVAGGKDIDTGSQVLAIITTVIYTLVTHWRHCDGVPR